MKDNNPPSPLNERILFATLIPMARLAVALRIPLRRIKQLTELAFYEETRRQNMSMKEIQSTMSIGFSKVGMLSREHKDFHATNGPDASLPRRILLVLWAVPLTEKHLCSAFPEIDKAQLKATIHEMVEQGRLVEQPGRTPRYTVAKNHNQFTKDSVFSRISSLSSLMSQVFMVIHARFFRTEEPALARTINFRVRDADLPRLNQFYKDALFPLIQTLDEAAGPESKSIPIKLSFLWSRDHDRETEDTTPGAEP